MTRLPRWPAIAGIWALLFSYSLLRATDAPSLEDRSLSVVNAGVSDSEDAPFVGLQYRFLPGDFVYLTFQISGFKFTTNEEQNTRAINLAYNATLEDARGRPLADPSMGEIKTLLNREDKNWLPKRRASFLIPAHVAAGDYKIHVQIKDVLSGKECEADVPVEIGGEKIGATDGVAVQHFGFFRDEDAKKPLELPAFQPGDTIYGRFTIVGFATGENNAYDVECGVRVIGPDGKLFVENKSIAQLKDTTYYPAEYLPADISITTKSSTMRGAYTVILSVRDLLTGRTNEARETFTLE